MFSQRPISDKGFSSPVFNISAALALAPSIPVFALSGSEVFQSTLALTETICAFALAGVGQFLHATIALTEAIPVFVLTDAEQFIFAAISLTEPTLSISIGGTHNSLTRWQAPAVNNTRKRQTAPALKELRQTASTLKQLRQSQPMLGE